jgi:hypothetical protein
MGLRDHEVLFALIALVLVSYLAGLTLGLFLCPVSVFPWQGQAN